MHHAWLPAPHGNSGSRGVNSSHRGGLCSDELLGERSPSYELRLADNIGERVTRGWISLARRVLQSDHVLPPRSQGTGKGKVARSSRVRPVLGGSTNRWTLPTYQYVRRLRRVSRPYDSEQSRPGTGSASCTGGRKRSDIGGSEKFLGAEGPADPPSAQPSRDRNR
jgi:hypothetical protein